MPDGPLILVPGLLCDEALWREQATALAGRTRVAVSDAPRRGATVAAMAEALLDGAPPRFALAGLSLGGYVALEAVRRAPGRVARLALLDSSARADTAEQSARRRQLMALAADGGFAEVVRALAHAFVHPGRRDDSVLLGQVAAMAGRVGCEAFLRQQRAIIGRRDQRDALGAIACPTLVLCGRDDALTPPALSEELAAGIPGARLVLVDRCGHLSTLERPHAVNAALRDWLTA